MRSFTTRAITKPVSLRAAAGRSVGGFTSQAGRISYRPKWRVSTFLFVVLLTLSPKSVAHYATEREFSFSIGTEPDKTTKNAIV
jgi:hypothetical protein